MDHWESLFDKTYLRWFHLQGKEVKVEISKVEKDVEMTLRGGLKVKRPVVFFKGKDKPLVLNVTNAGSIAALHGSKVKEWTGKTVTLYQSEADVFDKELRKTVKRECIRIK